MSLLVRGLLRTSRQLPGLVSVRAAVPAARFASSSPSRHASAFAPMACAPAARARFQHLPKRCYSLNAAQQTPTTRRVATAAAAALVPEFEFGDVLPDLSVGMHTTAGTRATNDDRIVSIRLNDYAHLIAVFDGHGGSAVAEYLSSNIGYVVEDEMYDAPHDPATILTRTLHFLESSLAAKKDKYLRVGSTAVIALVTADQVTVANVGDSRAFLVEGETATQITSDHRPNREDERLRIRAAGGTVSWKNTPRVNGMLALSRSVGYYDLRSAGVIAEPEIFQHSLAANKNLRLVLACDGVTDHVPAATLGSITASHDPQAAAEALVQHALESDGKDNLSAVVVSLDI